MQSSVGSAGENVLNRSSIAKPKEGPKSKQNKIITNLFKSVAYNIRQRNWPLSGLTTDPMKQNYNDFRSVANNHSTDTTRRRKNHASTH